MDTTLALAVGTYALVSVLLAFLAYTYARTALSTRAAYPLGQLVFSLLLLIHSAGTALGYTFFSEYIGSTAAPFMFGMAAAELVGVAVLMRITL